MNNNTNNNQNDKYQDPLVSRYTDNEFQFLFSNNNKYMTWRKCWIALAESQMELGLKQITPDMIDEMKAVKDIDYDIVKEKEKEIRHDVMAHVYEFGLKCPKAKGIIHLGATSQFVVCNTDLIIIKDALKLLKKQILNVISNLYKFCSETKNIVTLGYTHYQVAQPTTIGKRFSLYLHDLLIDLDEIEKLENLIKARGAKGTIGSQASYMRLFDDDYDKVKELDKLVAKKLGFTNLYEITSQTYSRKIDSVISKVLSGLGETATKFAIDLRLMSNLKIIEEPFEKNQTGSSAMAYKRNPMRSERMTSLSRKLINLQNDFSHTYANQWLERTLDDSAIRRMNIPQMFLLSNAILKLFTNITSGLVVYENQIKKHLKEELPFMATEAILMELSSKGENRQEMHELIKKHSFEAAKEVKEKGNINDLFKRLANDPKIPISKIELDIFLTNPEEFAGFSKNQTEEFLNKVKKRIDKYDFLLDNKSEISV
jgi:adenylosuccinate lyase